MDHTDFEIRLYKLDSPQVIVSVLASVAFAALGIFLLRVSEQINIGAILFCGALVLIFPVALLNLLTSKVEFNAEGMKASSIFRTTRLKMENIKTFGIYTLSRYTASRTPVDPENVITNKFPLLTPYTFISAEETYDGACRIPQKNINLPYNRDEFDMIRQWMKKTSAKLCV